MEQLENNEEVMKGDVNIKRLGKAVIRRHAELVKSSDGKNENSSAAKKGNTKNRKPVVVVEQSPMVR